MNINGIRKPAWFAYKYLHALRGKEIPASDREVFAATDGKRIAAVVWDLVQPHQDVSDRPYYTKVHPSASAAPARISFEHLKPGRYTMTVSRTGFRRNDAQTAYLEMGSPASLTQSQLARLKSLTRDLPERTQTVRVGPGGAFTVTVPMRTNDVALVELERQ
jgi:xylan 1,4-beta-xylosidase